MTARRVFCYSAATGCLVVVLGSLLFEIGSWAVTAWDQR